VALHADDRQYGSDENIGFSDITTSTSSDLYTFRHTRATSASMPPPTTLPSLLACEL
jgi:hypothetical protein